MDKKHYFCLSLQSNASMKYIRKIFIWARNIILFLFVFSLFMVVLYRFVPVYYTPLMFIRMYEQKKTDKPVKREHQWVPLNDISQQLVQAVVASEDNLFLAHNGFDFEQIEKAQQEAKEGKRQRGASTISQQTAKNVFLWPGHSYIRKGLEVYYTVLIELVWGKERIMEVYLNSIEMGDGVYGAEAVASKHFNKHAYQLTKAEAALIASSLPNPIRYDSAHPSPYMLKRQTAIMSLMDKIMKVNMGRDAKEKKKDKPSDKRRGKWRASIA